MAESLFKVVQAKTQKIVSATLYSSVICNKVTILDNQSWISIHVYRFNDWKWVPLPLKLEHVTEGGGVDNIMKIILVAFC